MSSLRTLEKAKFEDLFDMGGGYVVDFSNSSFAEFFRDNASVNIYSDKYSIHGDSKARRLRAFWELETDSTVGHVLLELLGYWSYRSKQPSAEDRKLADECKRIVERLLGRRVSEGDPEKLFLATNYGGVSFEGIDIDRSVLTVLQARYLEAVRCLESDAPLAVIFLCGSILEGLLLGIASANPKAFNQALSSPKNQNGKVKPFPQWSLAQFIDVASELGYVTLDVKKFSHALRDFRNYIHPYEQLSSGFNPDKHTAEICLQVLKAGIAGLSGERV
jgi:hypothetical protein